MGLAAQKVQGERWWYLPAWESGACQRVLGLQKLARREAIGFMGCGVGSVANILIF